MIFFPKISSWIWRTLWHACSTRAPKETSHGMLNHMKLSRIQPDPCYIRVLAMRLGLKKCRIKSRKKSTIRFAASNIFLNKHRHTISYNFEPLDSCIHPRPALAISILDQVLGGLLSFTMSKEHLLDKIRSGLEDNPTTQVNKILTR